MRPPEGWLTIEQAAERLGCSKQTVYRYARLNGLITHLRRGFRRGRYVNAAELEAWLESKFNEGKCE